MTIAEARIQIVKERNKADKISEKIKVLKNILIEHELSKDESITSFDVIAPAGKIRISKGQNFEVFNKQALKRIPEYLGGRIETFNHLSPEDQEFWKENVYIQRGSWSVKSIKK